MTRASPMSAELYEILSGYDGSYGDKKIHKAVDSFLPEQERQTLPDMLLTACNHPFPEAMSFAEKARMNYEALRRNILYYPSKPFPKVAYTFVAALQGTAVCMGVSELFHLCLLASGIPSEIIVGSINGKTESLHAWNRVMLEDGTSYFCDLTWDLSPDGAPARYFLKGCETFAKSGHMYRADRYPGISRHDFLLNRDPDPEIVRLYTKLWKEHFFNYYKKGCDVK